MQPIATDVTRSMVCVSVCVCLLGTRVNCAKTDELIEMPFGVLTLVGSSKHALDGVVRSFVRYCGQGSSLLWTPALRHLCRSNAPAQGEEGNW